MLKFGKRNNSEKLPFSPEATTLSIRSLAMSFYRLGVERVWVRRQKLKLRLELDKARSWILTSFDFEKLFRI